MIRAYDVLKPTQETETPKKAGLFDTLGDFFTEVKEGASSTSKADEMFDIAQKLYDPRGNGIQTEEEYENLKNQYNTLRNEREQSQKLSQEARQRLEANGHDWVASAGSLGSSLPDMARTMPLAIAAGIPTGGVGTAATIGAGLYGMYRGGRSASIEAFEKVLEDGGTVEQAMNAYNDSLLANSIAEAPGEALNLVGAGRLAKMLKGTKAAQKALGTGVGRIGADLIKDPAKAVGTAVAGKFGRTAGRAAGIATHALGETATEELTEHFQNYNADIQGQKAMGKDTDFFDMNNFTKYLNSDEAAQTTKDVFFSTLLLGGAPAAITSNQMLGNGYGNAAAVNASDTLGKILQKSDVQGKLDEKGVDFIKDTAADILKEQGREAKSEDLKLEDAFRIYTDDLINDAVANGVDKATAERNAVVDGYSALFGDTNREGTISETVHDLLKENYDLKDFAVVNNAVKEETLQEQANKQQDSSSNTQTNNETQKQGQETNSENVKFKTSNKTLGEEVASQTAGQGYINNRKTTGNAETNSPETNTSNTTPSTNQLFRKEVGGFREVAEKDEGDGNKLYTNGERQIRITQRPDGKFSVSDEADIYKPAAVKDTIEEAYNFMEQIDNGTATVAGERFMEGSKVGEKLPDEDGVIANKEQNVNGDGIEVNSVKGWYNYVDSQRGTKAAVPARMARAVARGIKRFGLEGSNIKLVMKRNNATGSYGRADIQTDPETGAINAVVELYAGSDVITVIHEFAHVGYYNMKADRRAAYDRWALDSAVDYAIHALVPGVNVNELKADNEFMAGLLNVMSAIDDEYNIHEEYIDRGNAFAEKIYQTLSGAIQVKENGQVVTKEVGELAGLVQIAPTVRYALDETYRQRAQVDSYTQEIIQRAIEERFAWDFSSWYAEGYTKGKKPATFIQRILQEVCQSLGRYLHVINVVSQRLESEGFDQIKEKNSDKIINGFDLFNEMSINTNDNAVAGYDPRTLKTWVNREQPVTETPSTEATNVEQPQQQVEQQSNPSNPFARWSDEQIVYMLDKATEGTTEGTRRALQEEAVRRGLVRTPGQEQIIQNRQGFMNDLLRGEQQENNEQDAVIQNMTDREGENMKNAEAERKAREEEERKNIEEKRANNFGLGQRSVSELTNAELVKVARRVFDVTNQDEPILHEVLQELERRGITELEDKEVGQYTGGYNQGTYNGNNVAQQQRSANFEFNDDNAQIFAERIIDENNGDKDKILKLLKDGYSNARNNEERRFITNVARRVVATLAAQRGETVKFGDTFYTGQEQQEQRGEPQYANKEGRNTPQGTRQIENNRSKNFFNTNPLSLEQGKQQESNGQVSLENRENEGTRGIIDTGTESQNNDNGGTDNGETEKLGRGTDLQGTGGEVQGQQTGNGNDTGIEQQGKGQIQLETDESNIRLDRRVNRTFNGIYKKLNLATEIKDWYDVSSGKDQKQNFINAIKTAQENNEHGAAVDAPSVEDLNGAVIILHKSGQAGFYIKDGDFKGVFKDPNLKIKGISKDMTILARELGAVRGDCYGTMLVDLYARAGFVPVAKLKFNEYYMDKTDQKNKFLLEEQPYVYALKVDTKDLTQFHKNLKDGVYNQEFVDQILNNEDAIPEIQDHDTAVRLGEDENGEKYIRDLDELSEEETEKLKEALGKYKFWDGKDLWYGGYSELLNYRDNELSKMPNKEKRVRDRSKTTELKTQEDVLKYVQEKTGKNFYKQAAKEGLEDAATLIDDLEYYIEDDSVIDDKLYMAQQVFEKVMEDKPSNYINAFVNKIINKRKNTKDSHDLAFLLEIERKLKQFKDELGKPTKETEERVNHKVDVIYDKLFQPYIYNREHVDTMYGEEDNVQKEKERMRKEQEENKRKREEEQNRKEELQKKKEEEKKKKQGNLTDEEYKEYEDLTKKEIELKDNEYTNDDLVRWTELSDLKDGETLDRNGKVVPSVRYMKQEVKNVKTKEYMDKLYKDQFYSIGRKLGYNTKRITDAYKVVDFLQKAINPYGFRNNLLYLNPRDEKMLGQRVKDFAKLNHETNRKLWDMNLKDKSNKTVYGKGMYRSPDGRWMQEFSDNAAKLDINRITEEMLNRAGLAGVNFKLGDILKHEELYKRFPKLKDMPVHFIDKAMVENGEIDGVTVDDLGFSAAYDYKNKQMFVNVDDFLGEDNPLFDSVGVFEKLESGEEEQIQEAIDEINEAINDILPFLLHETQHAVQDAETRMRGNRNKIVALVLHSDLKNVYQYIKKNSDAKTIALAQKQIKTPLSTSQFLDKENKTETEKKLEDILDKYMDDDEFYYSDLNEMEAYDTQHRFGSDETAMPLTKAEKNAYQNFEEGRGMAIRYMQGKRNAEKYPFKTSQSLAIMNAIYKKDFNFIGKKFKLSDDQIKAALQKREWLKEIKNKKPSDIKISDVYLDVNEDEALDNFIKVNDSITATFWERRKRDTGRNTVYSRGIYVDMFGDFAFTIDDTDARFQNLDFSMIKKGKKMPDRTLFDILYHPELFENYPQLKNIAVKIKDLKNFRTVMQYTPDDKTITINRRFFADGTYLKYDKEKNIIHIIYENDFQKLSEKEKNEIKEDMERFFTATLLHETQHAIQHIEGEIDVPSTTMSNVSYHVIFKQGMEKFKDLMVNNLDSINKRNKGYSVDKEFINKLFDDVDQYDTFNEFLFSKTSFQQHILSLGTETLKKSKMLSEIRGQILYPQQTSEIEADDVGKRFYLNQLQSHPPMLSSQRHINFKTGKKPAMRMQKGSTQQRVQRSQQILNTAFPNVRFQYAWHSTPHDFDAFTLDHLLEGEGAMAHGWGLYFAKSLPDNYRNYFKRFNIEEIKVKNNGKDITSTILDDIFDENDYVKTEVKTPNDLKTELERQKKHLSARQEYLEAEMDTMQEEYNLDDDELEIEQYQQQMVIDGIEATKILCDDIINDINNGKVEVSVKEGKARFLHVDIPNDGVLLREKAMFKDQPVKVQNAIVKLVNDINKMVGKNPIVKEELLKLQKPFDYDSLSTFLQNNFVSGIDYNGNKIIRTKNGVEVNFNGLNVAQNKESSTYNFDELTSKLLNKYGIKGISYNGRSDGECAVVFDNKAIDIINKFKREEGKWVSVKPQSQKQELTDTQKQRVERKLQEKKQNSTVRYQTTSSKITDDQIAREHSNTLSVSFTESAQKNQTNRKIMQYFDKRNRDFERTIDPNTKKVTYTRRRPEPHHTQNINYNGINDKVVTKKEKYGSKFKVKQEMFNDKEAIKKLASDLGVPEAYQKMMVQSLQGQKANVALTEGVEYNGKKTKGLYEIMGKIPEELQPRFTEYCVAFRILDFEKYRPDIVQKMTADEARDVIRDVQNDKEIADLFEKTRKDFVEYNIAMLHESLVTNGVISQELFDNMVAKDPNFVPLSKIMDDDVDFGYQSARGARSLIDIKSPIKSVKSSVREIKNPFAEMEKRTYEYYNTGAKNKAALTLINDVVNKIDVLVDGDKIARGQGIIRKVKIQEKDGKIITKPDPKNRIFYVCNNGVHEFYQAADPVVYAAMKNFTEQQAQEMSKVLDTMNKISKGMARVVRESATITYDFGGNNGIRDTLGAFVASEHGFIPIYDTIWGMKEVLKGDKSHYYKEYSGQVGQYAKSTRGELLADNTFKVPSRQLYEGYIKEVKKNYAILTNSKYTTTQRAKAFLKMILGAPLMAVYTNAQNFNEIIEQGTRVAEYKNARQGYNGIMDRLEKGGFAWDVDVSKDTVDKAVAAYKALDVTLFFQQHGNLGKKLNQYTPFFNAYLLGLEKTLNCLDLLYSGKDAMNQNNKTLQKEMLFKVAFFALMGIAASAAGAGDDDYEEAPDWEKNTFWIFPNGIRFGRDEIFGRTIGRIAEEAYTQARHKKFDVKKFGGIAIDAFSPNNIMPTILDIYGGLYMNRDSFTKRDIVPERMKSLPGPKQIDMYTSNMAKDFSSVMYALGINVSAKQVHYLLQKHFTNTFKYAEDVYSLIRGKEDATMARGYDKNDTTGQIVGALKDDVPRPLNRITGKFITNRTQYQSVNEFEDEYKEIRGKERAKDLNPLTKEEQAKWKRFEEAEKKMNKIRKKLKEIRENKNLNKYQRQEKAERLFQEQVRIAKKALGKE